MGPNSIALKYHSYVALFRRYKRLIGRNDFVVNGNCAAGGLFKSCKHAKHSGFAAAGRAEQRYKFLILEHLIKFLKHFNISKALSYFIYFNRCHFLFSLHQIENLPFVTLLSSQFTRTTNIRIAEAIAEAVCWL